MPNIIKNGAIVADSWLRSEGLRADQQAYYLPLAQWLDNQERLLGQAHVGVLLAPNDDPQALKAVLAQIPLIAIDFPKFADGRGFSIGRVLRERLGYGGELRAVGTVLPDQVFFLTRLGFNAFEIAEERLNDALALLKPFSEPYQAAPDQAPLFRRRAA